MKARQIIQECPWKSKKKLGGLALVGNGMHFFVAVNGVGGPEDPGWEPYLPDEE